MTVELLYTEACLNAAEYLPRLRQLVADAGVTEPVRVRLVVDDEQAQRERLSARRPYASMVATSPLSRTAA